MSIFIRDIAVNSLVNDHMKLAASSLLSSATFTDDYYWSKLLAAEADASRRLRVSLEPKTVFAYAPSQDEITALNGAAWVEESAYDYEPNLWSTEDWGYLALRKAPVIQVESIVLAYPAPTQGFFTIPASWIRLDKKAGHIRFVPSGAAFQAGPLSAFVLSAMGGGRNIPQMIQVRYRAGLENVEQTYPDLVDLIYKMATFRIIQDAFLPQSGSLSVDGLSQSNSIDMDKFQATIDHGLDVLIEQIHGPRIAFC